MTFNELNLIEPITSAIAKEGYETPSQIQVEAIPHILEGRDILGCAQTGTGKTAAFAIPIIQRLYTGIKPAKGRLVRALVLTPTRELAAQVAESFKSYARHAKLKTTVMYGGVGQYPQVRSLKDGADILVATPGRLGDLIDQGHVNLSAVTHFVLDEADRMLDMGFIHDVKKIIDLLCENRQTLLFSATMGKSIMSFANSILTNPVQITITPKVSPLQVIDQSVYLVSKQNKVELLLHLLQDKSVESALVFSRTKHGADKLSTILNDTGINADAIHGDKSQIARQRALSKFASGKTRILVATDVAARGIDIERLPFVFNYDLPNEPESYVHRIGRTGRAGQGGTAISFCDKEEKAYLQTIQKLIKKEIPVALDNPYPASFSLEGPAATPPDPIRKNRSKDGSRNFGKKASSGRSYSGKSGAGKSYNASSHKGRKTKSYSGKTGGRKSQTASR